MRKIIVNLGRYVRLFPLLALPLSAFAVEFPSDFGIAVPSTAIGSVGDFYNVVCVATGWLMVFGIIIGAAFVIWGGVHYITASGDDSKAKDAKGTIRMAMIGIVFLLLAVALVRIVASFFGSNDLDTFDLVSCGADALAE